MRYLFLIAALLIAGKITKAQNTALNTTAAGSVPSDYFTYDSRSVAHYGLGWYQDSQNTGAPMSYLSAYAGIKLFTGGAFRVIIDANGNVGIGTNAPSTALDVNGTFSSTSSGHRLAGFGGTGVYYLGTTTNSNFGIISNGGEVIRVGSDGRVGIGTSSPAAKFEIYSGLSASTLTGAIIGNGSNDANSGIRINYRFSDGASNLDGVYLDAIANSNASGDKDFVISTSGNNATPIPKFIIRGNGNVGIGTASPTSKLMVEGNIQIRNYAVATGSQTNSVIGYYAGSASIQGETATYGGMKIISDATSYFKGRLGFFTNDVDGTNPNVPATEKMTISTTGNVGIGTTTPQANLDIGKTLNSGDLGSVLARLYEGNSTGAGTYLGIKGYNTQLSGSITNYTDVKSFAIEHSFYGETNSSINFFRGNGYTGGSISFNTNNNAEQMRILNNGNVGIGISNPQEKLAVNGTVHAKQVTVDLNGFPDYVFKTNYSLRPLSDLKAYIEQNHHLPEIPAAAEVEKNGLNLGEMNKILVKKVEELTLYLIEKDKKENEQAVLLNEQQKEIVEMKKQIQKLISQSNKP